MTDSDRRKSVKEVLMDVSTEGLRDLMAAARGLSEEDWAGGGLELASAIDDIFDERLGDPR